MRRRQAAEWRRLSVSTAQYWVARYRDASAQERQSGLGQRIGPARVIASPPSAASECTIVSAKPGSARAGAKADRVRAQDEPCDGLAVPAPAAGSQGDRSESVRRSVASSGPVHVTFCRWTSSASPGSREPGTASRAIATDQPKGSATVPAGSSATRSSTITADWPSASCTQTSRPRPSPHSLQRALAFFAASSTGASRHEPRSATGRSRYHRRSPTSGPTDSATAQATREPKRYPSGSTITTTAGTTANSTTGRPSAAFGTS